MIYDCALPIASLDLIYCIYILFEKFLRPRANHTRNGKLHSDHGNEDCHTNLHVQRFSKAILIDFVVITLCLTCFTINSAVSSVVMDNSF